MYPLGLNTAHASVVVVGGGSVAERKVATVRELAPESSVTVIAPVVTPRLTELAVLGEITWRAEHYEEGAIGNWLKLQPANAYNILLVFAATDSREVNHAVADEVRRLPIRALVNVADSLTESDFAVPSHIRRGDVMLTIATGGQSPALTKALRKELEQLIPERLGGWLEIVADVRRELMEKIDDTNRRQDFWRTALSEDIMILLRAGDIPAAEVKLRHAAFNAGTKS